MPTTYAISASGKGIKIAGTDGWAKYFTKPALAVSPSSANLTYSDARINLIEFRQDKSYFLLASDDLTTVGGAPKSGTLSGIFDQIAAIIPILSGGGGGGSSSASDLSSGTLPDARLSTNVVQLTATQTLTGKTIDGSSNTLTGIAQSSITGLVSALSGKQASLGYTPLNPANNLSDVTAGTARTNLGLGTMAIQADSAVTITGGTIAGLTSQTITGAGTGGPQLRVGTIEIQSYGLSNSWIGENLYFDGTGFKYRATGGAGMLNFVGPEIQFRAVSSGSAGSAATAISTNIKFKSNADGSFAIGSAVNGTAGNYSGANLLVNAAGRTLLNTAADDGVNQLQVTGSAAITGGLNVNSTTQGFLPPRMTTTQKNAVASPAAGLIVYDTTLNTLCAYDGTAWLSLAFAE